MVKRRYIVSIFKWLIALLVAFVILFPMYWIFISSITPPGELFKSPIDYLPDHPTPIAVRTHTSDPVPYLLYDSTKKNQQGAERYCERTGRCSGTWLREGYRLIGHLFED